FLFLGPLLPERLRRGESKLEDRGSGRRRTEVHLVGRGPTSGNRVPFVIGGGEAKVTALTQEQIDFVGSCDESKAEQVLLDIRGFIRRGPVNVPQCREVHSDFAFDPVSDQNPTKDASGWVWSSIEVLRDFRLRLENSRSI